MDNMQEFNSVEDFVNFVNEITDPNWNPPGNIDKVHFLGEFIDVNQKWINEGLENPQFSDNLKNSLNQLKDWIYAEHHYDHFSRMVHGCLDDILELKNAKDRRPSFEALHEVVSV